MTERSYREDFPLLQQDQVVYLDSSATAQRPKVVLDAERDFYCRSNANPLRGLYQLSMDATNRYELARQKVQQLLNAREAEEIVFTRNTTESLNLVAYSYGLSQLKAGDEIVVSIMEHHSNLLPWQMVAKETGATLQYLECQPDGTLTPQEMDRVITPATKLVAVGQISNVLGCENPIQEIVARTHQVGGVVVMDAAQSVPHMPIDVQELDVDFLAFSGHKLYGPMGIGVLYGKRKWLEKMPPFLTGGEMIETVTRLGATYAPIPHKFEGGTVNASAAVGLQAAIDYVQGIGYDTIMARELELTEMMMKGMEQIPGIQILGSKDPEQHHGIVTFLVDGVHPHDVSSILDEGGIAVRAGHHCAQPLLNHLGLTAATRASVSFYNTPEDIQKFLACLGQVRRIMGYGA